MLKWKIKLSRTWREGTGEMEAQLPSLSTLTLCEAEWSASRSGRFVPKKNGGARWLGGLVSPRAALNFSGDKKTSLDWNSTSVHPRRSTVASHWLALPLVVSENVWTAIGGENTQSFKEIGEFQITWSFMYKMTEVFRCCCDGHPKYSVKTSNYLISITGFSFRQWQYVFLPTD